MRALHDLLKSKNAFVHLSCSGAGATLWKRIWGEPGASSYLVGAVMPYGLPALSVHLGYSVKGSCCSKTVAIDLAMASFIAACEHRELGSPGTPIGIGLTAAVASERLPRGEQRAHVVVMTQTKVSHLEMSFKKATGVYARREQDVGLADVAVKLLFSTLTGGDYGDEVGELAMERLFELPSFEVDGTRRKGTQNAAELYLPGTFNPLHDGHRMMVVMAKEFTGWEARYLVSASSAHKPSLSVQDLLNKVGQVRADRYRGRQMRTIEFSREDPLFVDKARQRPGATFIVGADTVQNLLDPKWGVSPSLVLRQLQTHQAKFLVLGRRTADGRFTTCEDLEIPLIHADMFTPLEGRVDTSSTELREGNSP